MKKPHIDFPLRATLDGTEELYTQNAAYIPTEQKFTVSILQHYILSAVDAINSGSSGVGVFYQKAGSVLRFKKINPASTKITVTDNSPLIDLDVDAAAIAAEINLEDLANVPAPSGTNVILQYNGTSYAWIPTPTGGGINPPPPGAQNGLTKVGLNFELGGRLLHDTQIMTDAHELDLAKNEVHFKMTETNPYWAGGAKTAFLCADNANTDTENFIGVTNGTFGSFAHLWAKKPVEGSYNSLTHSADGTYMRAENSTLKHKSNFNFSPNGVSMLTFDEGNTDDAGNIGVGFDVNEYSRVKDGHKVNLRIQQATTSNQKLEVLFIGLPTFKSAGDAVNSGYPIDGVYKTDQGELRIVV